jgi:hypothetical protein
MIELLEAGVVYANPQPHLRSRHAWHPSVVAVSDRQWFVSFDLAEAVEAFDYATVWSVSEDAGGRWSAPRRLLTDSWLGHHVDPVGESIPCTHSIRVGRMSDGEWVGLGARWRRPDPNEGLINRTNLGYTAMEVFLTRRNSLAHDWSAPAILEPPLVGPAFELCHRVLDCGDGRWLWPTSTWRGWDGTCPGGMRAVAWISRDRGRTWPEWLPIADESPQQTILWEVGVDQRPQGGLVATLWRFHEPTGRSLAAGYCLADRDGTFGPLRDSGLRAETSKVLCLRDGRVLCVFRRVDQPGLWAQLARLEGDQWQNLETVPVWQGGGNAMQGRGHASDELSSLRCGYPSLVEVSPGEVLVVFWCLEDCQHVIRWSRLRISGEARG